MGVKNCGMGGRGGPPYAAVSRPMSQCHGSLSKFIEQREQLTNLRAEQWVSTGEGSSKSFTGSRDRTRGAGTERGEGGRDV